MENVLDGHTFMNSIELIGFAMEILRVLDGKYISTGERNRGLIPISYASDAPMLAIGMSPLCSLNSPSLM